MLTNLMAKRHQREEWLEDVDARQRNIVFPNTLQNEVRFWRNIGNQPWTTTTRVGLALMAVFACGFGVTIVIAVIQGEMFWHFLTIALFVCLPIFGLISWATKRALQDSAMRRKHKRA